MSTKKMEKLKDNKEIDFETWKFYAHGKEKASYYLDKILMYLSVGGFIFSLKFVTKDTGDISYILKYSWLCFLVAILGITISYYFSEKSYEKTFQEYENEGDKTVCPKCKAKTSKSLSIYNMIVEILKIISLLSFVGGLVLLLLYYWK